MVSTKTSFLDTSSFVGQSRVLHGSILVIDFAPCESSSISPESMFENPLFIRLGLSSLAITHGEYAFRSLYIRLLKSQNCGKPPLKSPVMLSITASRSLPSTCLMKASAPEIRNHPSLTNSTQHQKKETHKGKSSIYTSLPQAKIPSFQPITHHPSPLPLLQQQRLPIQPRERQRRHPPARQPLRYCVSSTREHCITHPFLFLVILPNIQVDCGHSYNEDCRDD